MRLAKPLACSLAVLVLSGATAFAQTGKIAGAVTEAGTGEPLPGVNVVVVGTMLGSITDAEGYYTILNVPPGSYSVRSSFVGFSPSVVQDVRVNIDLTSEIDFALQEEAVGLGEVVVEAAEPVVKRDISANVVNLNAAELQNIATTASVADVIGLQAGAEGLSIRGSGLDELAFQVDGLSMRDGRTNRPFTGISYTSIDAVQVQTGGFNAEYGNVRSGLVNVVTKEGARDRYTLDVLTRYSPPSRKHFGEAPNASDDYWMRPFVDPAVAFTGTHSPQSPWDRYDQQQYPRFDGYEKVASDFASDDDPTNDLSPQEVQEVWQWFHRKDFDISQPDYEVDATLGGPVPLLGERLGGLRFSASYRQTQNAYLIPMARDAYRDRVGQVKLTTNVAPGMKLHLYGMVAAQRGHAAGFAGILDGGLVACCEQNNLFADHKISQTDIDRRLVGLDFTHTLSAKAFYELNLQRSSTEYFTWPGRERDSTVVRTFGSAFDVTEEPFGWYGPYVSFIGFAHGGHEYATQFDTSKAVVWSGKFDLTSQLNRHFQVKAGLNYIYNDQDIRFANYNAFITIYNTHQRWVKRPEQGAAYAQAKLEFEGLVANIGLRLDYFGAGSWYQLSSPFDQNLSAADGGARLLGEKLEEETVDRQLALSPRLGVSFPITTASKLFFNYGHFRQSLDPADIFLVREDFTGAVTFFGNPEHPMPLTVSYELGYEHNLFSRYLLRVTGYYKALEDQPRVIFFRNIDNSVHYETPMPYNYEDIRGLEVSVQKMVGRWIRGFANFTYMVRKEGNFGFQQQLENRRDQREYERETLENLVFTPVPEPFARLNLEVRSPERFGPALLGAHPLGGWHLNWLGAWRAGSAFTWTGGQALDGVQYNVRWRDYYNLDLRLSKDFQAARLGRVTFFADVTNLLNRRYLWGGSFIGPRDFETYMTSLHLPEDTFEEVEQPPYRFIPGDDRPGTFRKEGVAFVPIEVVDRLPDEGFARTQGRFGPLYYRTDTRTYHVWDPQGRAWQEADPARVDQVLEDKAYIDMPNLHAFRFLNPRDVRIGLRVTF